MHKWRLKRISDKFSDVTPHENHNFLGAKIQSGPRPGQFLSFRDWVRACSKSSHARQNLSPPRTSRRWTLNRVCFTPRCGTSLRIASKLRSSSRRFVRTRAGQVSRKSSLPLNKTSNRTTARRPLLSLFSVHIWRQSSAWTLLKVNTWSFPRRPTALCDCGATRDATSVGLIAVFDYGP